MFKDFDLIIFDLDGTLYPVSRELDSVYPIVALEMAAKSVNCQPSEIKIDFERKRTELARLINGPPTSTLTLMYFYEADIAAFETEINRRLQIEKYIQPDPHTIQTIAAIARQYPIFLFTTNNGRTTAHILEHLQLTDFFPPARRLTFSDINALPIDKSAKIALMKPALKGYEYVLEKFSVRPERCLMVGDSMTMDIEPATQLGMATYRVTMPAQLHALPQWLGINSWPVDL